MKILMKKLNNWWLISLMTIFSRLKGKDYLYDQVIVNEKLLDNKGLSIVKESVYILDLPKYNRKVIINIILSILGWK